MKVGRCELHTGVQQVEEVVGDNSLHRIVIAESQPHPQAVELGPAKESLPLWFERVFELPHEVDGLYLPELNRPVLTVERQQVDGFRATQRGRVEIAVNSRSVQQEYDDFLVRRSWSAAFHVKMTIYGEVVAMTSQTMLSSYVRLSSCWCLKG